MTQLQQSPSPCGFVSSLSIYLASPVHPIIDPQSLANPDPDVTRRASSRHIPAQPLTRTSSGNNWSPTLEGRVSRSREFVIYLPGRSATNPTHRPPHNNGAGISPGWVAAEALVVNNFGGLFSPPPRARSHPRRASWRTGVHRQL